MTEVRTVARQIQQLEIYLNNLVSALTRGELPVNLQPVTQIFDRAIASIALPKLVCQSSGSSNKKVIEIS